MTSVACPPIPLVAPSCVPEAVVHVPASNSFDQPYIAPSGILFFSTSYSSAFRRRFRGRRTSVVHKTHNNWWFFFFFIFLESHETSSAACERASRTFSWCCGTSDCTDRFLSFGFHHCECSTAAEITTDGSSHERQHGRRSAGLGARSPCTERRTSGRCRRTRTANASSSVCAHNLEGRIQSQNL
jgi:hypothetical protein